MFRERASTMVVEFLGWLTSVSSTSACPVCLYSYYMASVQDDHAVPAVNHVHFPAFLVKEACMPNAVQVGLIVQIPVLVKGEVSIGDDRRLFNFRLHICMTATRAYMLVAARTFSLPSQASVMAAFCSTIISPHFTWLPSLESPAVSQPRVLGDWQPTVA